MSTPSDRHLHQVQMGLGEAIQRLTTLEFQIRVGAQIGPAVELERKLILEALDHFVLEVGFDTDGDGLPDTVDVFKAAAAAGHRVVKPGPRKDPPVLEPAPESVPEPTPPEMVLETMPEKRKRQPFTKFLGSLFRWKP